MSELACLSRRSFLSESDRIALLFLMPSNKQSLVKQMQVFETMTQQTIWVQNYGDQVILKVKFLTGTSEEKLIVEKTIRSKINDANFMNVKFEFAEYKDEFAHVRITFYENQQSWSSIGTESLFVPEDVPTMNLSDLSQGNILHQFAHCLGFPHETQYIAPQINWNKDMVDEAFAKPPHFWTSKLEMKRNFYDLCNFNQFFNYKSYNPKSLMVEIWPCDFLNIPQNTICGRSLQDDFDDQDKRFFKSFYPFKKKSLGSSTSNVPKMQQVQLIEMQNQPFEERSLATENCKSTKLWILWTVLLVLFTIAMILCCIFVKK